VLVIDASVAVKWLVPEAGHEEAGRVLEGRDELIAPSIILLEVHSALLTRERLGSLPPMAAKRSRDLWTAMAAGSTLRLVPFEELLPLSIECSLGARHPLADCIYLAAGLRFDAVVLTADAAMCERGPRVRAKVRMLGTSGGD
jgi:predicted nucleic acid-binding protein